MTIFHDVACANATATFNLTYPTPSPSYLLSFYKKGIWKRGDGSEGGWKEEISLIVMTEDDIPDAS